MQNVCVHKCVKTANMNAKMQTLLLNACPYLAKAGTQNQTSEKKISIRNETGLGFLEMDI